MNTTVTSDAAPLQRDVATGREFILLITALMATVALSIDFVLPAFPDLRRDFGMAPDSATVTWFVTSFFFGLAAGPLIYGPVSDRFGRRPPLYAGLVLCVVGALCTAVAPGFGWVIAARVIWGFGAAAPRSLSLAMVRDRFSGDGMARLMSMIMAVFLLVPVIAPSVGAGLLHLVSWRVLMVVQASFATTLMLWSRRLPETLQPEYRRALSRAAVTEAARAAAAERQTVGFGVAVACVMAVLTAYLGSLELILGDVYDLEEFFPLVFGAIGVLLAVMSLTNARLISMIGVRTLVRRAVGLGIVLSALFLLVVLATDGRPPFWVLVLGLGCTLPLAQGLGPNSNTLAMQPVPHVAGTASALLTTVTTAVGAAVGGIIAGAFDGTARPFVLGMTILLAIAGVAVLVGTTEPRRNVAKP